MRKLTYLAISASLMLMPVPALAEVDTISGIGETRLDACKDAKDTAINIKTQNGFAIDSFGPCECEQRSENLWKCVVEYYYHMKKDDE